MRFNFVSIIISMFIFSSCTSIKTSESYQLPQDSELIYLIDSIIIEDPLILEYNGVKYISESRHVNKNNSFKHIITNNQTYILGMDLSIYFDMPFSLYYKITDFFKVDVDSLLNFYEGKYIVIQNNNNHTRLLKFETPPKKYLLALINVAYYLEKHASIDDPCKIESDSPINTYMRIVYPMY